MAKKRKLDIDGSGNIRGVVYRYMNVDANDLEYGWSYVGNTMNEATRRKSWNNKGNKNYGGKKITDARNRVGWKNFKYEVLEIIYDSDEDKLQQQLDAKEAFYIKEYDSIQKGYNASSGGTGNRGIKMSSDSIAKRTATRKMSGVNYAHTPSKYKGKQRDDNFRAAVSAGLKGKPKSPEHKAALKKALIGRKPTPQHLENLRASFKTRKKTPISPQGMANINAARYKIPVEVEYKDGTVREFESMKEIERQLGVSPGRVHNFLKSGNRSKEGYIFRYKDGVKNLPKSKQKTPPTP